MLAAVLALALPAGSSLAAVAVTTSAVAAVTAVAVSRAAPAKAATDPSVAVVLVNGESTAPETAILDNAGYSATPVTPAALAAMSESTFHSYAAVVIGDSSASGQCSPTVPSTSSLGTNWEPWVNGNVAVVGTAAALPGTSGADSLVSDAAGYAAAQPSSGAVTGLYLSLNCGYASAAAGTAVSLLSSVDGIGAAGGVTVNGGLACSDAGTVNTWEEDSAGTFGGFDSGSLGTGSNGFPSPACPVQEAFDSWPAMFTPVAYDAASDATANFTASDGTTGQPYILLGTPPAGAGTLALAPSQGGEVPAGTTTGGGSNAAAGGVSQPTAADPVNTENGDFTQSDTDLSVPTFGPGLDFTRTYDAQAAEQQTQTGTPGPLGYGWTDDWASSLSSASAVPGDIYTIDGLRTDNVLDGSPTSQALDEPAAVVRSGGNTYIADTDENRVLEVAGATGSQWGISMTAGDEYVIAGSPAGAPGRSGMNGTTIANSLLDAPAGLVVDSAGDLLIADSGNNRVVELAASTGTSYGISVTADDLYTVAGNSGGGAGHSGDGGAATAAFLNSPSGLAVDSSGDVYIADAGNSRVQEVFEGGQSWGQSGFTDNDIYTVAGSSSGSEGTSGNGTAAASALLNFPESVSLSSSGDLYIADTGNNRIIEVPPSSGTQWGISMTADDIYTVAGSAAGTGGASGNGGAATSARLFEPATVEADNGEQLYIADSGDNQVQEVARTAHTEWGQSMTANDIYNVAGTGTAGFAGDGSAASTARLNFPEGFGIDGSVNLYVADSGNNRVREVSASSEDITEFAGQGGNTLATTGDGGPATGASLSNPDGVAADSQGDVFIADAENNRVQEIAASTHEQFGISMIAGDTYTVAGSPTGASGAAASGAAATSASLDLPVAVAVDASGNLYISDSDNSRIEEVPATTHSQYGISMTAGDIYTVAGSTGNGGNSGDSGPATQAQLDQPSGIAVDKAGDLFIADTTNCQIREVPAAAGTQYGTSMTAGDIYTIAGMSSGSCGTIGDGGTGSSAKLADPFGVSVGSAGNVFIADSGNNRIQELSAFTHTQFGQHMTSGDIYTIAGSATAGPAGAGDSGDGGPAAGAQLNAPADVTTSAAGDLYIADAQNNQVREVAAASGTQWDQQMTAGDIYTIAGSAAGTAGNSGTGGPAGKALLDFPIDVTTDPAGDLFIPDQQSGTILEAVTTATPAFPVSPPGGSITVTQPGGAQVTFYPPPPSGNCPSSQDSAGGYCVLPVNQGATLTSSTTTDTYTFSPSPGSDTYTYSWDGQLISETDPANDTLTITPGSPAPGNSTTGTSTPIQCPDNVSTTSCQTIKSASGRALVIGSNASGLVTSVTDPMGRQWTYAYNSNDDLTSATDPMGNITSYTYGQGSNSAMQASDLLTITAPNAQPGGPDAGDSTVNVYSPSNQVTSQTDPAGFQTTFSYCVNQAAGDCMDAATGSGYVTATDASGNQTLYDYDQGTLAAQTDLTGTTQTSENDSVPDTTGGTLNDTATFDGNGIKTSYQYDDAGYATQVQAPDGISSQTATTTFQYTALEGDRCDGTAQAASPCSSSQKGPSAVAPGGVITPPSSAPPAGVIYNLYDTDGNELYTTTGIYQPGSSTASYQQTSYQLFKGNSITLNGTSISCASNPPSQSLPCATINPDQVVTQLTYNSAGDLASSSVPDGNGSETSTSTYGYDPDGEQTSTTSPDGNITDANAGNFTTVTAYNLDGEPTSDTQAGGSGASVTPRVTSYGYDADGNQTTVEDARGDTTTTSYNSDDLPTLVKDPLGNATLTCYDTEGNVAQTVPAAGVAANGLNASSCPTSYPSGYSDRLAADATTYTFDADGNQTAMTTPAPSGVSGPQTTSYTYDGDGHLIKTTAPPASPSGQNQVTVDTYDSAGHLASETTGYGTSVPSTTSYCYDQNGDQTSVVPPDGNTSGTASCETASPWVVSASSNPTQASFQDTVSYDSAGDEVSTTSPATTAAPSGATTTFTYDPAGNILSSTDPDGVTTSWAYTPRNQPSSESYSGSSAHSVSYGYDAAGNQTSMSDATGSSSSTWDPFGELTSVTNGAGQTTSYGYDADGDTTSITYPLPATATWATTDTVTYGYNNADVLKAVTDFNGNQVSITNNSDSLPSSEVLGSTGDTIATSYDNTDTPSAITLKNSTSTLQSFTYADAPDSSILTETDTPASPKSPAAYSYDDKGQLTSMTPGTGPTLSYGFDASGNLTTLPSGASASYDHNSELISSSQSGITTSYTYNADGERLMTAQGTSTLASGTWNGARLLTSYDGPAADMTAATYDGSGLRATATIGTSQAFTWNTAATVPQLLMDSANAYIYAGGGAPAEQVSLSSGTPTYLVSDSLNSVRGTVSSTGALTGTTSYDAWGNPQTAGGLTSITPFGYAGAYTDPTGLLYLINRYYDPSTGQFLSIDPDVSQTLTPYAYANDNPISNSDPTGDKTGPPPHGGIYIRKFPKQKKIYQGRSTNLHRRVGEWKLIDRRWGFRVAKRIEDAGSLWDRRYLLRGAEQAMFDAVEKWAHENGWTFVYDEQPMGPAYPNRQKILEAGRKALEKDGGLNTGNDDEDNYTPTGGGGSFEIPVGIIDDFAPPEGCVVGDVVPMAC